MHSKKHAKRLNSREIESQISSMADYYGVSIPEGGWEVTEASKYDFHMKCSLGHIDRGEIGGHVQTVIGYYEEETDGLKFFVQPDECLVSHEFGHYLYHQLYPGKCVGGTQECEEFAQKIEQEICYPTGKLGVQLGPIRKSIRRKRYGF